MCRGCGGGAGWVWVLPPSMVHPRSSPSWFEASPGRIGRRLQGEGRSWRVGRAGREVTKTTLKVFPGKTFKHSLGFGDGRSYRLFSKNDSSVPSKHPKDCGGSLV